MKEINFGTLIEVDFSNDETMIRDLENICADRKGLRNFIRNIKL